MPTESPSLIAEIAAKQAITEVVYRYCRALDRMDRDMAATIWHPDGTADYGPMFEGTAAEFIDWVWLQHERMLAHSHQITNILVTVDLDAGRAASESYVTATLRLETAPAEQTEIVSRGRYVDSWSCRDGSWAIDHRRFVEDFTNFVPGAGGEGTNAFQTAGRRDRSDPSYEVALDN
jgi:SnoaL-like domain